MDLSTEIQNCLLESEASEQAGDIAGAFSRTRQALQMVRARPDTAAAEASVLVRLGKLKFRLGDYAQARKLARSALNLASKDSLAYANALQLMGNCAAETNSLGKAEVFFQQVLKLSCEYGFEELRFRALNSLGIAVYYPRGQLQLAIAAGEEALTFVNQLKMQDLHWYPRANLVFLYWLTGKYRQGRAMLQEFRKAFLPGGTSEGYYLCEKALLDLDEGMLGEAIEQFKRGLRIGDAVGEPGLKILSRIGLSRAYRSAGDGPGALEWADDALVISDRIHYAHFGGWALIERARAARDIGRLGDAEADFRKAISILSGLHARFDLARSSLFLAVLLHQVNHASGPSAWLEAVQLMISGNYIFFAIQELDLIYPLIDTYLRYPVSEIAQWTQHLLDQIQKYPPPALRVITLGKFHVCSGLHLVAPRALRQRRAGELLALLLYSPNRSLLFDQVSECLWPDRDPTFTKTLFHHACASLRQALEPGLPSRLVSRYLVIKDDRITLTIPEGSWIDGEAFEEHYRKGEWQACIDLYQGDFLPDYLFADWTLSYRQRFIQLMQNALLAQIQHCESQGRHREVLEICQRLLTMEPWHEPAALAGMRACQRLNDRTGALRLYRNLEKTMQKELGITPSTDIQTLYRELIRSSR